MSLAIDYVLIIYQMIPFALTILVLHQLVFKPFSAYLIEREAATVGTRDEAEALQRQAAARLQEYEEKVAAVRAELSALRADRRNTALAGREASLEAARHEAEAKIAAAVEQIAQEREAAAREVADLSRALSSQIASQVLGRPLQN